MKVRIKNWDDAVKAALTDAHDWDVEEDSIFFIDRECGAWGGVVEGYKDGIYFCSGNGFEYPLCVVDEIVEDNTELVNPDNILRYGKVITDYDTYEHIHIRLISYNGDLYYQKMVNGNVVECRKVGMADA